MLVKTKYVIIRQKWYEAIIPWIIFLFFTTLFFTSSVGGMNSGDGTFYALTQAIAEEKKIQIDSFMKWTYSTDYSFFNNHYYSDREPGTSFLGVPFYILGKIIAPYGTLPYNGENTAVDKDSIIQVFTYLSTCTIGALALVFIYLINRKLKLSIISSIVASFSIGLGSLFWKYSYSFYREPLIISMVIISFYIFLFIKEKMSKQNLFLFGLFIGLAILMDFSKIYIVPIVSFFIYRAIKSRLTWFVYLFLGLAIPFSIIALYNYSAFHSFVTSPHLHKNYFLWTQNINNFYQAPLLLSMRVNLLNSGQIPKETLSFFWDKPDIANQIGAKWAIVWPYKGIFIQSPIMFLSIIGFILYLNKKRMEILFLTSVAAAIFIASSKLSVFWGGNVYDTRYFLAASILFMMGIGFWIEFLIRLRYRIVKISLALLTAFLILLSLYNGWYSALTHFAPHVTGEHRFDLESLPKPLLQQQNLWPLALNTFPNMFNIHLLFIFYFPFYIFLYILYFNRKTILQTMRKFLQRKKREL